MDLLIVNPPAFEIQLLDQKFEIDLQVVQGPAGPLGPAASTLEYIQNSPSSEWVINHNFGWRPNVSVTSVGGVTMLTEVIHISDNQVRVYFDVPQTGIAILS